MRTLNEVAVAALAHMESGTLELGSSISSELVSNYTDPALFQNEMAKVLRCNPLPFAPSAELAQPGDFLTRELCGIPLLATREESGAVRLFLNVCRHRGAKLVQEPKGNSSQGFACPFHGWVYGSNGELKNIPAEKNCFSSISDKAFRLKEVRAEECAGMIWVILDGDSMQFKNLEQLKMDIPEFGVFPILPFLEHAISAKVNWKIGVEAFLEVYHFAFAHAPYLTELPFPNLSLRDSRLASNRTLVPLRKPEANEGLLAWSQAMYFIFPATFVLFYEDHAALIFMEPVALDETKFHYVPLVPKVESLADPAIQQKTDFLKIIIGQDIAIMEGIQRGLASKANMRFTFTRLEQALGDFHLDLESCRRGI